jgi:lipopolysaccharide transport system ATP-binding protein
MRPILEIQNVGKRYEIQHLTGGYLSLRERMSNAFKFQKSQTENFWALKDITFNVQQGESIGIIGRNGAGKSTLLKILSKITPPTTGNIISRGRIASLLEVGTGFHPELTGRENIFFNGSLLGMKRKEIERKFDEIVDFSGVEKFLDTPLKHYSSGMQLRLAFAVAAFLEPEILIIDEVLAVGDAEFQKKCLGKMEDVRIQGRTILFVSHNMSVVKTLCRRCLILSEGQIEFEGSSNEAISWYQSVLTQSKKSGHLTKGSLALTDFKIIGDREEIKESFNSCEALKFELEYQCFAFLENVSFAVCFNNANGQRIISLWTSLKDQFLNLTPGSHKIRISVPSLRLIPGIYEMIIYAESNGVELERLDNFRNIVVGFNPTKEYVRQPSESLSLYLEDFLVEKK